MSRRNAAEKRPILPDPQFNSRLATMMVVRLMPVSYTHLTLPTN